MVFESARRSAGTPLPALLASAFWGLGAEIRIHAMQPKKAACRARKTTKGMGSGVLNIGGNSLDFSPCPGRMKAVTAGTSIIRPEFVVVHSFRFPLFP
jgi:hypothetical protein